MVDMTLDGEAYLGLKVKRSTFFGLIDNSVRIKTGIHLTNVSAQDMEASPRWQSDRYKQNVEKIDRDND